MTRHAREPRRGRRPHGLELVVPEDRGEETLRVWSEEPAHRVDRFQSAARALARGARGPPLGHDPFYSREHLRVAHRLAYAIQRPDVARVHEAGEAVADGAVRAFEQSWLTGVRRVRTVAVAGVESVHRRLSVVVRERHRECWVTWVNLE